MSLILKNNLEDETKENLPITINDSVGHKLNAINHHHNLSSSSIVIADKNNVNSVKKFAYAVCREYLSGAWREIDYDDFSIQRIS